MIELPLRTFSELNNRVHWRVVQKRAKLQRTTTALVLRAKLARVELPIVVELTRVAPRALDDDNLQGALKHVRDGVADAIGVDDRDVRVRWTYAQARGPARYYGVRVAVSCVAKTEDAA